MPQGDRVHQKLAAANPAITQFHGGLAGSHHTLGQIMAHLGKPGEAEVEFRKALEIQQTLADRNPANTQFRSGVAQSHNDLGSLFSKTGKPAEAEAEIRSAIAIQQKLAAIR